MPEMKLEKLKAIRRPLAKQLDDDPNQIQIAIEIKGIDDQIAECTRLIQLEKRRPVSR
jgi:hypothetical protein